ncbi:molybdopterin molybdotransferase MoeA [Algibacillus agarilyticus]|uniref:molybdopterin molybdotransferase MoeA n=1 Tax=Algibacillus agarilyticus TaxID=2234133 RepID=UPI0018E57017|nr:gephyrin-like molybdotransferase Glp [Algibacillus agarilyticus]
MAVTCCDAPGLMPVADAMAQMLNTISSVTTTECVELSGALNRVLAQSVISPMAVPHFDNSAMDGYAFSSERLDEFTHLTLVGKVFAGDYFSDELKPGECVRIMTGAPLPQGADTVQMQENVMVEPAGIKLLAVPNKGANVRYAGEDIAISQVVLSAGTRIQPGHLGLLASLGIAKLQVKRNITVGIFSTGDELIALGQPLKAGQIYDSNRYFLVALMQRLDVKIIDFGCLADDIDLLRTTLTNAAEKVDVLITSGGVSVGEADFTKTVLDEIGQVNFWKLAIKPGKPFAFGQIQSATRTEPTLFFGLPGNPVSSFVTCHQLVFPALLTLMGEKKSAQITLAAKTQTKLKKRPGRMDYQRGNYTVNAQGEIEVTSTGAQGSGMLTSICQANCYILLAQDQGHVEAGAVVDILPFDKYIS